MPPRPLRPKDEISATAEGSEAGGESNKSGKRRVVSSACIPCRKRKSKCDGNLPSCSTCIAVYRTECFYDGDGDNRRKTTQGRDNLQSLQQRNDALDVIVASLRALPEQEAIALLHNVRSDANPDVIAASLRANVNLQQHLSASQSLEIDLPTQKNEHRSGTSSATSNASIARPPVSSSTTPAPTSSASRPERVADSNGPTLTFSTNNHARSLLLQLSQDAEFIEHLLDLYLTWVHPFHHFFPTEYLLHVVRNERLDGRNAVLVHAVLAFACHYSDRPQARIDVYNSATSGDHFFAEAKNLLDRNEKPSLAMVQAMGIMSIREASQGRDSSGYQYAGRCVRMAIELNLHLSVSGIGLHPQEAELRRITFWAVFNLETIASISLGRLSQLPKFAADVEKPSDLENGEPQSWKPYEDTTSNIAIPEQPLRPLLFLNCLSTLCELASDMVNTFYAPHESFTSRKLAAAYANYQEWYNSMPDVFRLDNTSLPHVLLLHMYYHVCVLHLFRPYIKLDLRGANLYPRDTCTSCANEISRLMNGLRAMYGLRRVCYTVNPILLSAATIHLLNLPDEVAASNLSQAMHDLHALSTNHQFAARCVEIIRSLATKWNIHLPKGIPTSSTLNIGGQSAIASPSSSAFFASSSPNEQTSKSTEFPMYQGSAFIQTGPQQHAQAQALTQSAHTFYDETSMPLDPSQTQMQFWTPFPMQAMPLKTTDMDTNAYGTQQMPFQWPGYDMSSQSSGMQSPRQSSASSHREADLGGPGGSWQWGHQ